VTKSPKSRRHFWLFSSDGSSAPAPSCPPRTSASWTTLDHAIAACLLHYTIFRIHANDSSSSSGQLVVIVVVVRHKSLTTLFIIIYYCYYSQHGPLVQSCAAVWHYLQCFKPIFNVPFNHFPNINGLPLARSHCYVSTKWWPTTSESLDTL
jgi:hypothetical protein